LDSNNNPHMSYYTGGNEFALKYASKIGDTFYSEFVDGWGIDIVVGFFSSIGLDADNNPHISYYNHTGGDLLYATARAPVVVNVAASDPDGSFTVTIDAGADKGAPITSWTEISTTNIASYTVTLTDGDMVMVIEGQLLDPNLEGQIVLEVDPVGEIITYEINIAPFVVSVAPTIESSDSAGTKKDTFDIPEDVYVIGNGYSASATYDIYVVEDVVTWTDGMAIPSRVSGTATTVSSDGSGNIPATLVWSGPLVPGKYDIVVDVNGNGIYDAVIDALDDSDVQVTAGFHVIPEVLGTIVASTAMIIAFAAYFIVPKWRKRKQ